MRLIKASSINSEGPLIELVDFTPDKIPRYSILSHTWGSDEVVYADIRNHTAARKDSFEKIRYSCQQTIADGFEYVWIDSCCIDKSSSAELSEAINSMFDWYDKAEVCYAYLSGVSSTVDTSKTDGDFAGCRWFTRGWTLQELLAPDDLIFFSDDWVKIGEKLTLSRPLSVITGIEEDILKGTKPIESASIAKRMSWASHRITTRPEDVAYCLMGLFGVNMPMLYGEGDRAFLRLQEEIMKQSDDQSLFAWVDLSASTETYHGLLAKSPLNFEYSNSIVPYQDWEPRPPYSMTNRGLRIDLPLTLRGEELFAAALDCPAPPDFEDSSFLAIYLKRISHSDQQFARVRANQFAKVQERGDRLIQERGKRQTIFVRQTFNGVISSEGVFPQHVLQLRCGPSTTDYTLTEVITSEEHKKDKPKALMSSRTRGSDWLRTANGQTIAFRSPKAGGQLAGAVVFSTSQFEGSRLLIMFGSADSEKAGFHAQELPPREELAGSTEKELSEEEVTDFESLQKVFKPSQAGNDVELQYYRVRVSIEPIVADACKYLMADILVEPINRPWDPYQTVDTVIGQYQTAVGRQNRVEAVEASEMTVSRNKKVSAWKRLTARVS
ncbi:Vegetative incompatibility protein HET-E-1 [Colletotrichum siamense]|nr:Vegetative incompatibility protein HET-E-1 [Colletotrichum siamense]KAF4879682.1 Vegetative incompatibility protein HET-E-1 [Colletotrichum siamense]